MPKTYVSLPKGDDVVSVGLNRAVDLIAEHAIKKAAKEAKGGASSSKKKTTKKKTAKKKTAAKKTTKAKKKS